MFTFFSNFFVLRRARKALSNMRSDYRLYADLLTEAQRNAIEERFTDIRQAIRVHEIEDLPGLIKTVGQELQEVLPKRRFAFLSEGFDVLISALAVAFCFRAYFYEPFRIPTGSMQPTLYGIHAETWPDSREPSTFDAPGLSTLKWLITGETLTDVTIERSGRVLGWQNNIVPGYTTLFVATPLDRSPDTYHIPDNVIHLGQPNNLITRYPPGKGVSRGQRIWRGTITSGDFVFVNRWIWNFRKPQLGETIVFSTHNIKGLPDHQHYIKRLCGRPGDQVEIKPNDTSLWVNGEPLTSPSRFLDIAQGMCPWDGAPAYAGYQASPPLADGVATLTAWHLGPDQYLALGDNSENSLDSRYWGTVPERNLLGPATFIHWPFTSPRWGEIR
jgi:signal peptidase I